VPPARSTVATQSPPRGSAVPTGDEPLPPPLVTKAASANAAMDSPFFNMIEAQARGTLHYHAVAIFGFDATIHPIHRYLAKYATK